MSANSLHALSRLPGYVYQLDHLELGLDDVQVVVQAGAFAPLGHNGQLRLGGVAHKQQDVHMTRFPGGNTQWLTINTATVLCHLVKSEHLPFNTAKG